MSYTFHLGDDRTIEVGNMQSNGRGNSSKAIQILKVTPDDTSNFSTGITSITIKGNHTDLFKLNYSLKLNRPDGTSEIIKVDDGKTKDTNTVLAKYVGGYTIIPTKTTSITPSFTIDKKTGNNVIVRHPTQIPATALRSGKQLSSGNKKFGILNSVYVNSFRVSDITETTITVDASSDITALLPRNAVIHLQGTRGFALDLDYTTTRAEWNAEGKIVFTLADSNRLVFDDKLDVLTTYSKVVLQEHIYEITLENATGLQKGSIVTLPQATTYTLIGQPAVASSGNKLYEVTFSVPGHHAHAIFPGDQFDVANLSVGGNNTYVSMTVTGVLELPVSPTHSQGVTQVTGQYMSQEAPLLVNSAETKLIYPSVKGIYGSISLYDNVIGSSLKLVGKGTAYYNDTTTWGEAIQQNLLDMTSSFRGNRPPIAPTQGQLWYDVVNQQVRVFTGRVHNISSKNDLSGTITIRDYTGPKLVNGDRIYIFNNITLDEDMGSYRIANVVDQRVRNANPDIISARNVTFTLETQVSADFWTSANASKSAPYGNWFVEKEFVSVSGDLEKGLENKVPMASEDFVHKELEKKFKTLFAAFADKSSYPSYFPSVQVKSEFTAGTTKVQRVGYGYAPTDATDPKALVIVTKGDIVRGIAGDEQYERICAIYPHSMPEHNIEIRSVKDNRIVGYAANSPAVHDMTKSFENVFASIVGEVRAPNHKRYYPNVQIISDLANISFIKVGYGYSPTDSNRDPQATKLIYSHDISPSDPNPNVAAAYVYTTASEGHTVPVLDTQTKRVLGYACNSSVYHVNEIIYDESENPLPPLDSRATDTVGRYQYDFVETTKTPVPLYYPSVQIHSSVIARAAIITVGYGYGEGDIKDPAATVAVLENDISNDSGATARVLCHVYPTSAPDHNVPVTAANGNRIIGYASASPAVYGNI